MLPGRKILENKGFVFYEDSQYYIFERRVLDTELFDQIKIKKDTRTVKCITYILTKDDGYKEEALTIDETILAALLVFISEIKKKGEKDGTES
jgi:hypothetical protein